MSHRHHHRGWRLVGVAALCCSIASTEALAQTVAVAELCKRGTRFGAHNLNPAFPDNASAHLKNTFVGTFFNGGVRIYRIVDAGQAGAPPTATEIGYFIPVAPKGNPGQVSQIDHVIVDEKGIIYADDRFHGGLYVLKYTGKAPLD